MKKNILKITNKFVKNAKNLEIFFDKTNIAFSALRPVVYEVLDLESDRREVWLKNLPYCLLNNYSRDHIIFDKDYNGEKNKECKRCKESKFCQGFPAGYIKKFGSKEIRPIPDLPLEVMIEIEPRCNFECKFCFNKISFAKYGRGVKKLTANEIKKIINHISQQKIKIIRFTGGEPMLRQDIFEVMSYAKKRGLEVRLNSNGSLIDEIAAKKMKNIVSNILIPIESWTERSEEKITGAKMPLDKKITAINLLRKNKIPIIRVGTVATRENIYNLEKIAKLVLNLPIDEWEFYFPVFSDKKDEPKKKDLEMLVEKIIKLKKKTGKSIMIANAIPFCSIKKPEKMNFISCGALFDDGHNRLVIDPRGFVKPHYYINKNIGSPLDILKAWNSGYMLRMRSLDFLKPKCKKCRFKYKCRGGSQFFG